MISTWKVTADQDLEVTQLFILQMGKLISLADLVLGYQLSSDRGIAGSKSKTCVRAGTMLDPPLL